MVFRKSVPSNTEIEIPKEKRNPVEEVKELQVLDNQALQAVEGQAGADLSLKLSLKYL